MHILGKRLWAVLKKVPPALLAILTPIGVWVGLRFFNAEVTSAVLVAVGSALFAGRVIRRAYRNDVRMKRSIKEWTRDFANALREPISVTLQVQDAVQAQGADTLTIEASQRPLTLEYLERKIDTADKRIAKLQEELNEEKRRATKERRTFQQQYLKRIDVLERQLEDAAVGGIWYDIIGAVWLVLGAALAIFA